MRNNDKVTIHCDGTLLLFKSMEKLIKIRKIGEGTYGCVYEYSDKKNKTRFAVKESKISEEEGIPPSTLREILVMNSFSHPNLLELKSLQVNHNTAQILLPYKNFDLSALLKRRKLTAPEVKNLMFQLISGVAEMHDKSMIHRDLKPQNLLVDTTHSMMQLSIADFGLSRVFFPCSNRDNNNIIDNEYSTDVCTLWYRPPEILLGGKYDFSADMWSVGVIMAEMILGEHLFPGDSEIDELFRIFRVLGTPSADNWADGTTLPYFQSTLPRWKPQSWLKVFKCDQYNAAMHLVRNLLQLDPQKRFTAKQALNYFYFLFVQ